MPTRLFLFLALGQIEVKKVWFFIGLLATTTTTQQLCRQAESQCKIKKGKIYDSTIICRKYRFR